MVITCLLSMFLGSIITFFTTKNDKKTCESISKDKYIEEFSNSYNNILSNYYNEIDKIFDKYLSSKADENNV